MVTLVRNGFDANGLFSERPKYADPGCTFYAEDHQRVLVYDADRKVWFPQDGRLFYDAAAKYMVDHFGGGGIASSVYDLAEGNDAQALLPALNQGYSNIGQVDLVSGDAGSGTAADASTLAGPALIWTPDEAEVLTRLRARVKLSAITTVAAFFGMTDVLPSETHEMPVTLATTTFTTNITDGGGLLFDTAATTDTIRGIGVNTNTDGTPLDTGDAFVAGTFLDLLLEISPLGIASVYLDDVLQGTFDMAPDVALAPILHVEARSTASRTLSADYWFCHQDG